MEPIRAGATEAPSRWPGPGELGTRIGAALALTAWLAAPAPAQILRPPLSLLPPAPAPAWRLEAGFSYLVTGGNTDTSTFGLDAAYTHEWGVWGIEGAAAGLRAEEEGETAAESYSASLRGKRAVAERLEATAGLKGERDRFAGIDLRTIADAGVLWSLHEGPRWAASALGGLTWSREELRGSPSSSDALGAILQLRGTGGLGEGSELQGEATYYPSFEESDDWRAEGRLGLQAAIDRRLALKVAYELRYDHRPVPGFATTDTRGTASLVVRLGRSD